LNTGENLNQIMSAEKPLQVEDKTNVKIIDFASDTISESGSTPFSQQPLTSGLSSGTALNN
jgi:hypothetical protein